MGSGEHFGFYGEMGPSCGDHLGLVGVWLVSEVLSATVESAMECQMRVDDVFCAVSVSDTMRSALSVILERNRPLCVLPDAHAFGCHLLHVGKFLCEADHSRGENTRKQLGYETHDAVGALIWCHESVLCAGVQCEKTSVIFHQMGPKVEDDNDGFGLPFSIRRILGKRNLRSPWRRRVQVCLQNGYFGDVNFCLCLVNVA